MNERNQIRTGTRQHPNTPHASRRGQRPENRRATAAELVAARRQAEESEPPRLMDLALAAMRSGAAVKHQTRDTMKNTTTETLKDTTPKTAKAPKAKKEAAKPEAAPKVEKTPAPAKPEPEADAEPVDRLPTTVGELKESKSGLVTFLFLAGKDKDEIAKELQTAFKLAEGQAVKIVRRITGRARFFQRAFDLVPGAKASTR